MRFVTLNLKNYGPFRDAPVLDLAGGHRGLHLIVGPNEAGKSTALRAIRALLFDFPNSTPDNHGRDLGTLRVGATLRDEAGNELAFLRRKRGTRLWTADDRGALPADALAPFLGRLDEATFASLFSADHAELVEGGEGIIRGKGRLGEMLFSAGTGLAQLDRVQKALQGEIESLFKSRNASIPVINKTLGEWKQAREQVKEAALPTQDWVAADAAWKRALATRAEVTGRKHESQAGLDRWRSWLGALRLIPRRQEVLDRLGTRPTTETLRAGFADAYRSTLEAGRAADNLVRDARDVIAFAEAEMEKLGPDDLILLEGDAIGRLHADLGRYAGARHARPELELQLARIDVQVDSIAEALPEPATAIPVGSFGATREAIGRLARESAVLVARVEEVEADLARFDANGPDPHDDERTAAAAARWVSSLEDAIGRASAPGDLEAQGSLAARKLAKAGEQAAVALRGLTLWAGTLADLEALAIPPDATFDRAAAEIRAADERLRTAEVEQDRLAAERLDLILQGDRDRVSGAIPTDGDLDAIRARREGLWQSIRLGWVDGEPIAPIPGPLAGDFEADVRQADAVADALRRESSRVAGAAQREIDRRNIQARIELIGATRDRAAADRVAAVERWAGHWRPLGIEPLSPLEMKEWAKVERHGRLRSAKAVRDAGDEVARIAAQVETLRGELGHALDRVGEPPGVAGESLAALLVRGRSVVARIGARRQRAVAQGRLDEVRALEADWIDRWGRALAPLGLTAATAVATAEAVVEQLGAWLDATRQARTVRDDLADRAAIEGWFAAEARALATRLGPDPTIEAADETTVDWQPVVAGLVDRLARASESRTRRLGCLARLAEEQARLARGQSALNRADEALATLVREAGCPTADDLPAAIRQSAAIEQDRAALRQFDEQLDGFAGAMTREELLEAVAGWDETTLATRIAEEADRLADLEAEANRHGEAIGAARERLDAMGNAPGAADAEQVVQGHAARLGAEVEKYARLKLAAAVLRDAVERHRAKHQGPVLDRAGALFARLTGGSFVGLQADQDEKGEPVLRGVRGVAPGPGTDDDAPGVAGPLLDVAAMSEGTADQLYLALRLASLWVHLDDHEPAPLVADDILINFDDGRARAALEALAELSGRTQVLFFTHHDHLAEIARSCLPADVLFVHRLTPRGPIGDGTEDGTSAAPAAPRSRRKRATTAGLSEP